MRLIHAVVAELHILLSLGNRLLKIVATEYIARKGNAMNSKAL